MFISIQKTDGLFQPIRSDGAGLRCGVANVPEKVVLICLLGLAIVVNGCGKKSRLAVAPVQGRVTYNGQGVPRATVIFFPADDAVEDAKKMRPFADTDAQGHFELKTYVRGDGAPPGRYRVSIIGIGNMSSGGAGKDKPGGEEANAPAATLNIPPTLAQKYGNIETSGIEVTVEEGENNLPPFELKGG